MRLTSLQKCNRARWQMLFHPTELTLEFCNPLTFGQMSISCTSWALTGWNMTRKNLLFIHDSLRTLLPPSQQHFILIGWEILSPPPQTKSMHHPPLSYSKFGQATLMHTSAPHKTDVDINVMKQLTSGGFLQFSQNWAALIMWSSYVKQKFYNYCLIFNYYILVAKTQINTILPNL